jgi:hypothetical protein
MENFALQAQQGLNNVQLQWSVQMQRLQRRARVDSTAQAETRFGANARLETIVQMSLQSCHATLMPTALPAARRRGGVRLETTVQRPVQ